ncbi:MAG: phosphohistidine phosphatase SixA [Scytolyngbya sp. HA4215-MV1]|jgi:phosphohistidine phosphatase|nr:phosphohistidine phosphatase SixA [Scytolyngbya sp. HA4215-MV1]
MSHLHLYLIRHGLAAEHGSYANDDERPLTEEGRQKTRQVAKQLRQLGLQFNLMLTSPLVRARQTADILQKEHLAARLEESALLAGGVDIRLWLEWLTQWQRTDPACLALVGHEPDLSAWAEILLWGEASDRLILKKAGVIGLQLPDRGDPIGNSQLFWLTPPRFLL